MNIPKSADVTIIGGGVMGASIAYHLIQGGCRDVVLLEKEQFFGQGATGRCAGGVRYQFSTEINVRLSLMSLPMLERFEAEVGQVIEYKHCGYLFLLSQQNDIKAFKASVNMQHNLGVQTEWLGPEEIHYRLPMLHLDDIHAGTFNERDGIVDPNGVVMGYIQAARRGGLKAYTGTEVIRIVAHAGAVQAVKTNHGEILTRILINAAGPWAGQISKLAGLEIPIIPLRRQWCTTSPFPEISPDFPFVIDFAQSLYFHREGQGILTGMSNPAELSNYNQIVDPEWEGIHLDTAVRRFPLLEKAGLVARVAGLYEVTPDAHPIIGKTPLEGYYLCSGFSGHGFMHGPAAGKLISELILHGKYQSLDISMLDLARFSENRMIRELNVI